MNISEYLDEVRAKYKSGQATEHSYRPALQKLFESINADLTVINEPKKSEAGMPDFLFQRGEIPVGWCEAKDVDKDVIKLKGYSIEQRKRYEKAFSNLIYTNGVDFEFIREGQQIHFVSIADFLMGLQPSPDRFDELERQLRSFAEQKPISIRSAAKLAEMMAAKAAIIKDEIGIALDDDPEFRSGLGGQFKSFKANLLPNLTPDEFADIYAETITYGMFAARFHDDDLSTFSRQEALEKLPASNPFLKGLFEYIAGPSLPPRLKYIVDDLVQVMRASDPHSLFRDFGKFTARNDPFVHFYEDFLAAYNPKKRKSRGVWYTPEPVVDFIVRAVDDVLKSEFGLADGLADTSKVTVDWDTGQNDAKTGRPRTIRKDVHKVQILDPATGTGTFLAKAVQLISDRVKARAPGKWSNYVEGELLPRLHGFELLMASYAMCHMKLDMMLTETGYTPSAQPPRLSVWLTNTLEPAEREVRDLFFQPLAEEARGASEVKRQAPIMCVFGNPPYAVSSSNRGDYAMSLIAQFKKGLSERNLQPLSDDYLKFIGFGKHMIEKNGDGILAFITNNSFLDGVIHRRVREELMNTFNSITVINLHGDSNKAERTPDGGVDQNVFDIRQGVSIVIAVRCSQSVGTVVKYRDVYGTRPIKEALLGTSSLKEMKTKTLSPSQPNFFFVVKTFVNQDEYESGFRIDEMFPTFINGIATHRDHLVVGFTRQELRQRMSTFFSSDLTDSEVSRSCGIKPSETWSISDARKGRYDEDSIVPITYRPFDNRVLYYDRNLVERHRWPVMSQMLLTPNLAILCGKQNKSGRVDDYFITDCISEKKTAEATSQSFLFPLYIHGREGDLHKGNRLNFDQKIYELVCEAGGIDPADQTVPGDNFRVATGSARPSEVKVLDYIYGVLHSPKYRKTFAEFLKIDFPRIPFPSSPENFRHISEKGEAIRRLHLIEPTAVGATPFPYLGDGDDAVANGYPRFVDGRVSINNGQCFTNVPERAWTFHVGGYQPAQKWLKDRRGRSLSWDEIGHYQKIIKILVETDRIMEKIELPLGDLLAADMPTLA